ncbi:hypothetical protein ACP275_04G150900 [Erythranthe tilingii]
MKNSPSTTATSASTTRRNKVVIIIVLIALANMKCSSATLQETHWHKYLPTRPPRLLLQTHRHHPHPPAPPPPRSEGDDEIDPRYGVEKRLVPSGPNPLHN